ncbi:phosphatidate cytidylyltransferase [Streptomyces carminius]|uniref:Phosphatidate cytidylyltransferase n=1 Tax=Streptomyces carminius TaxID=2665496 RepID=A0A2M8M4Y2_9ACTN|nr:phosphatidate cytidylyltransferase [Streptomyces carminius]
MNDSSWGAPPGAGHPGNTGHPGYWGPPGQGPASSLRAEVPPAPAGYVYEGGDAPQTRHMPNVPENSGGDQEGRDDRAAGRPPGEPPTPGAGPSGAPAVPGRRGRAAGRKRAGRDLRAAIGVGLALGATVALSLFVYKPVFVGVVVVAVVVGLWELTSRLAERKQIRVPLVPLAVGGAAMVVAGYVRGAEGAWVAMSLTVPAVLVWRMTDDPREYLRDATAGVFAAFYVPFLATFVTMMLAADDGPWRVLVFLLLTVVSDTGAYAVGWRFGRRKLAPRISPGKTREGLLGAMVFAMAAGALSVHFLIDGGAWWQGLLLGLAVAVSATLGDLGESVIKRDLGIKDMGSLLPGHGGIMDRLDSLLPTAPVVWLLLTVFTGTG